MSTDLTSLWKSWRTRLLQHRQVGWAIGGVGASRLRLSAAYLSLFEDRRLRVGIAAAKNGQTHTNNASIQFIRA